MPGPNAFDETRSPFLLKVLQEYTPEARETEPENETVPSAEGECECGGCRETAGSDEAFEAEDAYEVDQADEVDESGTAFDRYLAAEGEEGEYAGETDLTGESPFVGEDEDATFEAEDESGAEAYEAQDSSETFEADGVLESEDEAPDLAYDIQEEDEAPDFAYDIQEEDESPFSEALAAPVEEGEVVVSTGEFGDALAHLAKKASVPDSVFSLLKQSSAFVAIVKALDAKYLHLDRPSGVPVDWGTQWSPNADGVLTKGPHVGRRMIAVRRSPDGSSFRPFGSADAFVAADLINVEAPAHSASALDRRGVWLERLAHESIHAHRHLLGLRRQGATPAARIRAGIDDEIATRTAEGQIVNDLRTRFSSFRGYRPTTGSRVRGAVERDFAGGRLRLTYLEHFVLVERLEAARRALQAAFRPNKRSRTAEDELAAFDAFVDRIPLEQRPLTSYLVADPEFKRPDRDQLAKFQMAYPRIQLIRRIVDARWRSVKDLEGRDVHRDAELETMRQEHAAAFFGGLAAYTTIP